MPSYGSPSAQTRVTQCLMTCSAEGWIIQPQTGVTLRMRLCSTPKDEHFAYRVQQLHILLSVILAGSSS